MAVPSVTQTDRKKKPPPAIGIVTIFLLVFVAVLFDGMQAIAGIMLGATGFLLPLAAGLNFVLTVIALTIFCMWFLLLGRLAPSSARSAAGRMFAWGTGGVTEILPLANGLAFGLTGLVVSLIILTMAEDAVARGKTLPFGLHRLAGGPQKQKNAQSAIKKQQQLLQKQQAAFLGRIVEQTKEERRIAEWETRNNRTTEKERTKRKSARDFTPDTTSDTEWGMDEYGIVDANNIVQVGKKRIAYNKSEGSPHARGFVYVEIFPPTPSGKEEYRYVRAGEVRFPSSERARPVEPTYNRESVDA